MRASSRPADAPAPSQRRARLRGARVGVTQRLAEQGLAGREVVVHERGRDPAARAIRATRTSSIPWLEISSQATSRIRSRPPPGRPRGRGEVVVVTPADARGGATLRRRRVTDTDRRKRKTDGGLDAPQAPPPTHLRERRLDVALALAIGGGTAYAATKIGTSNIRYHAVTGSKVATNAITASKVKNSALSGSDIRNNSLRSDDIRAGTLLASDFAPNQSQVDKGNTGDRRPRSSASLAPAAASEHRKSVTAITGNGRRPTRPRSTRTSASAPSSRRCAATAPATRGRRPPAAGDAEQIRFTHVRGRDTLARGSSSRSYR